MLGSYQCFQCTSNHFKNPLSRYHYFSHLTDEETEAQWELNSQAHTTVQSWNSKSWSSGSRGLELELPPHRDPSLWDILPIHNRHIVSSPQSIILTLRTFYCKQFLTSKVVKSVNEDDLVGFIFLFVGWRRFTIAARIGVSSGIITGKSMLYSWLPKLHEVILQEPSVWKFD